MNNPSNGYDDYSHYIAGDQEGCQEESDAICSPSESEYSQRNETKEIEKFIGNETRIVRVWRWVVIIAMVIVAGGVTTATSWFLHNEETKETR